MIRLLKKKRAFTIIELIVIIAVLGILVGIAIPVFNNITETAEENVDKENGKIIATAVYRGFVDDVLIVNSSNKLYNTVTNRQYGATNNRFFNEMEDYLPESIYPISENLKDRFFFKVKKGVISIYYKELDKTKVIVAGFNYGD